MSCKECTAVAEDMAELQAFKAEWEPYLIQLNQALTALLGQFGQMLPAGMIPPQVKSFMLATQQIKD